MGNNQHVQDLKVRSGGRIFDSNNALEIAGDWMLNGTYGGDGSLTLSGSGTVWGGTGVIEHTATIYVNGDKTIPDSADLKKTSGKLKLDNKVIVSNHGSFVVENIAGNGSGATWVQDSSTAYLKVGGSFFSSNGKIKAFTPGNTVEYYDGGANIKQPDSTYYHLKFSGSGTFQINNAALTIGGDLNISATLKSNGYNIHLKGDWTNEGVFKENSDEVVFLGANEQTITDPAGETFYDLKVDKSGGQLILEDNVTVSNTLTMNQGDIDANGQKLTLGTGTSNPGSLTHSSGAIIGKFERWINSTTSWVFPVGVPSEERTATITFNDLPSGGSLVARFVESGPGNSGLPLKDGSDSIHNTFSEGFWDFQPANYISSNDHDITLEGNGFTSFSVDSSTRVLTREAPSEDWMAEGTHEAVSASKAERSGISSDFPKQHAFGDTTDCQGPDVSTIQGLENVCIKDSGVPYSVVEDPAYNYSWNVEGGSIANGSGTDSIEVDWGSNGTTGQVEVTVSNSCTEASPLGKSVSVHIISVDTIKGIMTVPAEDTVGPYRVDGRSGYSYTWTVNGGSIETNSGDSITVAWGSSGTGNLTVEADSGACPTTSTDTSVTIYDFMISAQDGKWGDPSTWDCGCVPTSSDNVIIDEGDSVTLNNNRGTDHLIIRKEARLFDNNNSMTIDGNFTLDGEYAGDGTFTLNGAGTRIGGEGTIAHTSTLYLKNGNKTVRTNADLDKTTGTVQIASNVVVENKGSFHAKKISGGNVSSTWVQNSESSYLKIDKSIFSSNGTLDAGFTGNTVEYSGGSNNIETPDASTYYNLGIKGSGTFSPKADLIIDGDLTITSTLKSNGYDLQLKGDWTNSGTFDEGSERVILEGDRDQVISNSSGETFYNLEIEKGQGKVILSSNADISISDSLYLSNGIIDGATNNSLVIIPSGSGVASQDQNSYVEGTVQRTGTSSFTFPLGKGGRWAPLGISATNGGGTVTFEAEYTDSAHSSGTADTSLNNVSLVEFWSLDRTSGTDSVKVTLHWKDASRSGIDTYSSDLRVAAYNGQNWTDEGHSSIVGNDPGSVTSDLASTYNAFTFGSKADSINTLGGFWSRTSGDWGDSTTWTSDRVPDGNTSAIIRDGHDVSMTGDKGVGTLLIRNGGTLSMAGHRLKIDGDLSLNGSLDGNGEVYFEGSSEQILKGSGATFYDITVKNSQGVTAKSGRYQVAHELDIENGTFDVSGANEWTMRSDSNAIAARIDSLNSGDSLIGKVQVQRWIKSGNAGWIDLASPVKVSQGQPNVADWDDDFYMSGKTTGGFDDGCAWSNGCFWSVKYYDPASGDYQDVTDTGEILAQGKGFELFMGDQGGTSNMLYDTTVTVEGFVRGGSKTVSVSTANGAFNLIANPFASQIDFDQLYNNNNIGDTYYVAAATGNFETYQVGVGSSDPSVPNNGTIASSQGFWITSNDGSDITFTQSMKTDAPVSFSKKSGGSEDPFNLNLESNMNRFSCRSFIRPKVGSNKGYDEADVPHRPSPVKGAPALVFGTATGELLRWNAISPSKEQVSIPVIVDIDTPGTYMIKGEGSLSPYHCAYLEDKSENKFYDPKAKGLSFQFQAGRHQRFVLHLTKRKCRSTGIKGQELAEKGGFSVHPNPSSKEEGVSLRLIGMKGAHVRVSIFDMQGKQYHSERIFVKDMPTTESLREIKKDLAAGTYVVSVTSQEKVYKRKLVIQ